MTQLFSNNVDTQLDATLSDVATSATLADGSGLHEPTGGDYELLTLIAAGNVEIVKVTARTGNSITIVRAQEGTTARSWVRGTRVFAGVTAGTLEDIAAEGLTNRSAFENAIAIGPESSADATNATAVGRQASANYESATAFGRWARASEDRATSVGRMSIAWSEDSTVIGSNGIAQGVEAVCLGSGYANAASSICVGDNPYTEATDSIAIGRIVYAGGVGSIAIGAVSEVDWQVAGAIAIGSGATINSGCAGSVAIGLDAETISSGDGQIAIGASVVTRAPHSLHIGALYTVPRGLGDDTDAAWTMSAGAAVIMSEPLDLTETLTHTIAIPAGLRFFVDEIGITVTDADAVTTQPTMRFGITGDEDKFAAAALTSGLEAAYNRHRITALDSADGAETLRAEVTVAGDATTLTGRIYWRGFAVTNE